MKEKHIILDEDAMLRAIRRISHEILERNQGIENAIIIGIKRRGIFLAERLAKHIEAIEGLKLSVYPIDISLYRDDIVEKKEKEIFSIDTTNRIVILVDDVLFTGRTIRSALNALMDAGRPTAIRLAVLIDRGHRELPIRADYVAKNVPTARNEKIKVHVKEQDGEDKVVILEE